MSAPELHYDDLNPQGRACVILIKLLNLNVELHCIDSLKGSCPAESCIGEPLFFHYDMTLRDSHSIMIHLCEYCRNDCGMQLYPSGYEERVNVMNKLYFEGKVLFQRYYDFMMDMLKKPVGRIDFDFHECQICNAYDTLDKFLCDHPFMAGFKFTIADVAIMATVSSLDFMFPIESFDETRWQNLCNWLHCMRNMPIYSLNYGGIERQRYIMDSIFQVEPSSPRASASADCVCCSFGGQMSPNFQCGHCVFNRDLPPQGLAGGMNTVGMYRNCPFQRQQSGFTRPMCPGEFMPTYADIPRTSRARRPPTFMPSQAPASSYLLRGSGGHGMKRPTWNLRDKRQFPTGEEQDDGAIHSLRVHKKFQNSVMRSATDLRHRHFGSFQKGLPTGEFPEVNEYAPVHENSKRSGKCSSDEDDFELLKEKPLNELKKRLGDLSLPESKRATMVRFASNSSLSPGAKEEMYDYRDHAANPRNGKNDKSSNWEYHPEAYGGKRTRDQSPKCAYRSRRSFTQKYEEVKELHYNVLKGARHEAVSARVESGFDCPHTHPRMSYKDPNDCVIKHRQSPDMIDGLCSGSYSEVKKCPSWQEECVEVESDHTCNCMDPFKYKRRQKDRPTAKNALHKCHYFKGYASYSEEPMKHSVNCVNFTTCHTDKLEEKSDPKFQYEYFIEEDKNDKHPLLPFTEFEGFERKHTVADEMYLWIKDPVPGPDPHVIVKAQNGVTTETKQEVDVEGLSSMMPAWIAKSTDIYHDSGYSGAKYLLRIDEKKKSAVEDEDQDDTVESWHNFGKLQKILLSAKSKSTSPAEEVADHSRVKVVPETCGKVDEAISCQTLDKFKAYFKDVEISQQKEAPKTEAPTKEGVIEASCENVEKKEEGKTIELPGDDKGVPIADEDVLGHAEIVATVLNAVPFENFDRKSTTTNLTATVAEKISQFEKLAQRNRKHIVLKYSLKNPFKCYKYPSHSVLVAKKVSESSQGGTPVVELTLRRSSSQWTPLSEPLDRSKGNATKRMGELFDLVMESKKTSKPKGDPAEPKELKEIYVNKLCKCMRSDSDDMIRGGIESRKSPAEDALKQLDAELHKL